MCCSRKAAGGFTSAIKPGFRGSSGNNPSLSPGSALDLGSPEFHPASSPLTSCSSASSLPRSPASLAPAESRSSSGLWPPLLFHLVSLASGYLPETVQFLLPGLSLHLAWVGSPFPPRPGFIFSGHRQACPPQPPSLPLPLLQPWPLGSF